MQIEELRQQAEQETAGAATTRRPSWAPALVLEEELFDLCRSLEWLGPEDKSVARLWAIFADPKAIGTWQRDHLSMTPLHGHRVRGFELVAGEKRSRSHLIYRTQKSERGHWDKAPNWCEPYTHSFASNERRIRELREFLSRPPLDEATARVEVEAKRCLISPAKFRRHGTFEEQVAF